MRPWAAVEAYQMAPFVPDAGLKTSGSKAAMLFLTSDQFAYTAGVNGKMVRERPAANFFVGWFAAESLIMAETGQSTGAGVYGLYGL